MRRWRDGMNRVTIRAETGEAPRGGWVRVEGGVAGVVRAPGWLIVSGPTSLRCAECDRGRGRADARARLAEHARYRRRQRHGPSADHAHGWGPPGPDDDADE